MSPWRMMTEWGVPALHLHAMAYELCERLAQMGRPVPDIAFAGGFSGEDHVFKSLALGAPYCKAVCMGRALMIPGMVGKNVANWMNNGGLPRTVSQYGDTPEEIFVCYEQVADIVGMGTVEQERHHRDLVGGGAHQFQAVKRLRLFGGVGQQEQQ